MEILVPKVPDKVEIGGNLVENWCQIGEKEVGNYLPLVALSLVSLIRTGRYGVRLISNLLELGWFKINFFCGEIEDPVEKQGFSWTVIR